ncbi:Hsp90 chaperone hsp82 [Entomophthora muscae]|uniref:Hsp90 chaperone hsp82 n=1 Tax=Entomophthora muscae TaxID=34485 RepID=A0ACC2UBH8_9FUNG|nr:Hsp90 chaperone hsp82 [Entomophthora muscae]
MSLIINTFYSYNKIFLCELVSNSSNALDKICYQSLTDSSQLESEPSLHNCLIPNKENDVLIICNTDIGITKADLVNNLGTIVKSGTKAFMEVLSSSANISIIGQFVEVITKHNDAKKYIWESAAGGSFITTHNTVNKPLGHGSKMCLYLKKDQLDYLMEKSNKEIIKKHSEFIEYYIQLVFEKEVELKIEENTKDVEEIKDEDKDEDSEKIEDDDEKKDSKKKTKTYKDPKKNTTSKALKEDITLEIIQKETKVSTPKVPSTLEAKLLKEPVK